MPSCINQLTNSDRGSLFLSMVHNILGKQERLLQLIDPAVYVTPEGKINYNSSNGN